MAAFVCRTRGDSSPQNKPRVYFTCHPEDMECSLDTILKDIFRTHDCAVYYTGDMSAAMEEENRATDLGRMNLFVIAVTKKLLTTPNRAMDSDFPFAVKEHIPVLPIMMEDGLDSLYSRPDRFGEIQYLHPFSGDDTAIRYEEKLKKFLDSVLISDETAKRVRAAFDAYIFLSYRKKDRRYANELMRMIHDHPQYRDIAVWYDEFLTPGESFFKNIGRALGDSKMFTLLVTPSLLEEPNFVMSEEYPAARQKNMDILAAEMESTDREKLRAKYEGIPDCVNPHDSAAFRERLHRSLAKMAVTDGDNSPEHLFLMGLAYLDGIDMEVNRPRGIELITRAAEMDLPEAVKKLVEIYELGIGTPVDHFRTIHWQARLVKLCANRILKRGGKNVDFDEVMEYMNSMLYLGVKYYDTSNYEEAAQNYRMILDFSRKFSSYLKINSDLLASAAYNNLGVLEEKSNHVSEAAGYYRKAIALREKAVGKYPEAAAADLTDSYQNAARAYERLGQYKNALKMLEKAESVYRKYGERGFVDIAKAAMIHKVRGTVYDGMRNSAKCLEEYSIAAGMLRKMLDSREDRVVEEYADTVYDIGIHHAENGTSEQAMQSFLEAERYYRQLYGKDPLTHTQSMINVYYELALLYKEKKSYPQAVSLMETAEKLCIQAEKQNQPIARLASKVYACKGECLFEEEYRNYQQYQKELSGAAALAGVQGMLRDAWHKKSLQAFQKAKEYMDQVEMNHETAMDCILLYNKLGRVYYRMYKNDLSQECYHKAYNLHVQYYTFDKDKRKILGILYYNFALLSYHNYHDKAAAREMMDKAIKTLQRVPEATDLYMSALDFKLKYLTF